MLRVFRSESASFALFIELECVVFGALFALFWSLLGTFLYISDLSRGRFLGYFG